MQDKVKRIDLRPRFIKEYASYLRKKYKGLENKTAAAKAIGTINGIERACKYGFITPTEAARLLSGDLIE